MRLRYLVCLLVVSTPLSIGGSALAAPPPAAAQPPSPTSAKAKDHADELFDQGTAAFDAGRFQEAEAKFEAAWALKQTHDIAGNLGIVEIHLGKTAEGAKHLAWALEHLPPTEASSTRKGLEQELQKARSAISSVHIRVNVAGAEITVNGHVAGKSPLTDEVFVEPGVVNVAVHLDGYAAVQEAPTVLKGETHEVSLELVPSAAHPEPRSRIPLIVLGAASVASLGLGIAMTAISNGKSTDADTQRAAILKNEGQCAKPGSAFVGPCDDLGNSLKSLDTTANVARVAYVASGVLLMGAVTYALLPPPKPRTGWVRAAPVIGAGSGGVVVTGAW